MAKLLVAIVSLHADDNEAHDLLSDLGTCPLRSITQEIKELVYFHSPNGTCPPGNCWKPKSAMTGTLEQLPEHRVDW